MGQQRQGSVGGRSQDHDFLSLGIGGVSHPQQHSSRRCTKLEPETNIKTYFDMKVGVSVWQLPLPDQDIKLMIKSNDAIMACSGSSHKIAKPISNHNINIRVLVFIQSLYKEANSSSKMKITSAACMFLFLRNSAGANIRGSRVLIHEKKQEEPVGIIDVSRNHWSIDLI